MQETVTLRCPKCEEEILLSEEELLPLLAQIKMDRMYNVWNDLINKDGYYYERWKAGVKKYAESLE